MHSFDDLIGGSHDSQNPVFTVDIILAIPNVVSITLSTVVLHVPATWVLVEPLWCNGGV